MAYADLYELRDKQDLGGQDVLNIYHVEKADPAYEADDIAQAYLDSIMPSILLMQPDDLQHSVIEVESLADPLDFATLTFTPNAGLLSGSALSTFSAAAIQFNRRRTDMKNGQKRWLAGIETRIAVNTWDATMIGLIDDVGDALVADWELTADPGVKVCEYVIIKRICVGSPPPDPCVTYRLPDDDAELVMYHPIAFITRDKVRSQVSRKKLT